MCPAGGGSLTIVPGLCLEKYARFTVRASGRSLAMVVASVVPTLRDPGSQGAVSVAGET